MAPAGVGGGDPAGRQRSAQTGRSTVAVFQDAGYVVRAARVPLAEGLEALRRRIESGEAVGPKDAGAGSPGTDGTGSENDARGESEAASLEAGEAMRELMIHPRCRQLIESLSCYHFDTDRPQRQEPVKDGYDHTVDALRYLVVNLERGAGRLRVRSY